MKTETTEHLLRAYPPMFMKKKEAAIVTSLSESTIHRAIRKGELPVISRGSLILIRRESLTSWLEAGNNETKQPDIVRVSLHSIDPKQPIS
jgi:excisionase family DNA binding protein